MQQGEELVAWIKTVIPHKTLQTVFITHGHSDHYFTLSLILKHFSETHTVATANMIKHMKKQKKLMWWNLWTAWFLNQLKKPLTESVKVLSSDRVIRLEGHKLFVVEIEHSDTHDLSFLHVSDLNMMVADDICYNKFHQWLMKAITAEKQQLWINRLQKIIALQLTTVIVSHKRSDAVDSINNCYFIIKYIENFDKLKTKSQDAPELYHKMLQRYSVRLNLIILWEGCKANYAWIQCCDNQFMRVRSHHCTL